jgi:hypothetical protein
MFFGKIISYTCDLHLELNILNPLNIMFMPNVEKMNPLCYSHFFLNFMSLKLLNDLFFIKFTE